MPETYTDLPGVFIHPKAIVETEAVGAGTRIWAFAHVTAGAQVGMDCNICDHTFLEKGVSLGDRVTVKCGIYLWEGVHCADDVFLGPNVVFTNDVFPRSGKHQEQVVATHVGRGASIGANSTVLAGVTIGNYALIGIGSVVTRDVPGHGLVYGNPARLHGFVSRQGRKLELDGDLGTCPETGERYRVREDSCVLLEDDGDE